MKPPLSYCAKELYTHDRDHFLQCLFIPAQYREAFFCLYALNLELAGVHTAVSEEMIGHIRYAWWEEAVESGKSYGNPLLEALASTKLPKEHALRMVAHYREHYPAMPADVSQIFVSLVQRHFYDNNMG